MNSLNLRVSSVKTGENIKKNSEIRTSPAPLPAKYGKQQYEQSIFVKEFVAAVSIPEQVNSVKNIFNSGNIDLDVLQFITDLFFDAPLKHPVRNQIAKLAQKTDDKTKNYIVTSLYTSIQDLVQNVSSSVSCSALNTVITSLSGCFENFPEALQSLNQNLDIVMPFLSRSLTRFIDDHWPEKSPSVKNEFYLYIHNCVRVVLSIAQEFCSTLAKDYCNELDHFHNMSKTIMVNLDMPMDVKTNSGILTAYIAKMTNTYIEHISYVANGDCEGNSCLDLCLCIGVINTMDASTLINASKDIKKIILYIIEITNRHSTEPSMLLGGSRALLQMSKNLLSYEIIDGQTQLITVILRGLTLYILSYIEHSMDSVRHICKDLLRNIIKVEAKLNIDDLLDELFAFALNDETAKSLKCIILNGISTVIGTEIILRKFPQLFDKIFMRDLGKDLNVKNCYENLMVSHTREVSLEKWQNIWIYPLIKLGTENKENMLIIEDLINKAIKCNPKVIDFIVNNDSRDIPFGVKMSSLSTLRKNGLTRQDFQIILNKFQDVLNASMVSNDDNAKITVLKLVVETHKTTEPLSDIECELILAYLEYNVNCQSPAIRQQGLGLILKGLIRLQLCLDKAKKERNDRQNYYRSFLKQLANLLVNNLFPGANFSRRSVSLQLLQQTIEVAKQCEEDLRNILPTNITKILFNTLNDSYEGNKTLAIAIFKLIENKHKILISLDEIQELIVSVRPNESLTAAYYLNYYCTKLSPDDATTHFAVSELPSVHVITYCSISWCINILKSGLEVAQKSILLAARINPLYGSVLVIRHQISQLNFNEITNDHLLRELIATLIVHCKLLTEVVGPIVNSSSPEGHLPNDFSELPEHLASKNVQEREDNVQHYKVLSTRQKIPNGNLKTTSQMLLLCAWRTVKEVSLLLGEIVLRSVIKLPNNPNNYLITVEQITEIGFHFKELLSETKHRGAFEQAYVGFSKLCTRLWRSEHLELHELPMKWLYELVEMITTDQKVNEKICATRRSAGVPFMVQALITSELQIGTNKALTYCMQTLIQLCSNSTNSTEARSHGLNILRALFRCTDLNETIGEYIADGLKCAIQGNASQMWSLRNSSTLLFATLITRIFGVQRTKDSDNLNIRNKMTGRIFFLRYPKLYDFFLSELEEASSAIWNNKEAKSLHPLLLIMSRLYPSALEGTESNLKLSAFIELVSSCSASPEMLTRVLTAKAIVAFLTFDAIPSRISDTIFNLKTSLQHRSLNINHCHGMLLQLFYLVKAAKSFEKDFGRNIIIELISVVPNIHFNCVIWKTVFDILIEIFTEYDIRDLPNDVREKLIYLHITAIRFEPEFSKNYTVFRKTLFIFGLQLLLTSSSQKVIAEYLEYVVINYKLFTTEEIETCLNVILLLSRNTTKDEIISTYECIGTEIDFAARIEQNDVESLWKDIEENDIFKRSLEEICTTSRLYPECAIKAYSILSELKSDHYLEIMVLKSSEYPDDVKNSIAKCVENYVRREQIDESKLDTCVKFLEDLSVPWNSDALRFSAAKILRHLIHHIADGIKSQKPENAIKLISLVLCLLRDDDSDVRDHVSQTVFSLFDEVPFVENIVASYAQKLFLKYVSKELQSNTNPVFTKIIIKAIIESQIEGNNLDNNSDDLEVFDRNESNVFAESHKTVMECFEIFLENFKDDDSIVAYFKSAKKDFLS